MEWLRIAWSRGIELLVRRRRDARLDEELRDHLDRLTQDLERGGLSPADASAAARRAFGGVDQVRAAYRDQRGWPALDALLQDVRVAGRLLARDLRFSATVVAVLGLGLGVSHLFLTLTYAHTVRGLPMPAIDRVLDASTIDPQAIVRSLSLADFSDLRTGQRAFDDLAAFANGPVALAERDTAPERVDATFSTASAFTMARVTAMLGRVVEPADERPGGTPVVVLAERLWRSRYAGDPAVLGREVLVDGRPATIVGVVSDASGFPSAATLWLPLTQWPGVTATRDARAVRVFGRLRGATAPAAGRADLEALFVSIARAFPDAHRDLRLRVVPLNERFVASRAGWWPFMLAGTIVIAVASINVANLLLVRSTRRGRELAIQTSLGASRWRLTRQLLVEAFALAAVGAGVGLAVSRALVWAHERAIPPAFHPYWAWYDVDRTLLAGLAGLMAATVIVAGVVPSLVGARVDVTVALKDGGRTDTGRSAGRLLTSLALAVQLALAVVLLTEVGLGAIDARRRTVPTDAQLSDPSVLTASYALSAASYGTADDRRAFHHRALERLHAVPGASAVALASHLPLGGAMERRLRMLDRPVGPDASAATVWAVEASAGYFEVLGLTPVRGRGLTDADAREGQRGVVVNERFAALHLAVGEALGRHVAVDTPGGAPGDWATIVGIVPDVRQHATPDVRPLVYVAVGDGAAMHVLVRSATPNAVALRALFRELDPTLPLHEVASLAAARENAEWLGRSSERLALIVVFASVLLAIAGVYAVLSHRLALRTREIGVRLALGARPRHIAAFVGASVRTSLVLGLALGLLGVLAWTRAFAPGSATSAAAVGRLVAASAVSLAVMTALACALPARRAAALEAAEALRRDS